MDLWKFDDKIDALAPIPRIFMNLGMTLVAILVADLVLLAVGDPLSWTGNALFVLIGTAAGYAGSVIRNRSKARHSDRC